MMMMIIIIIIIIIIYIERCGNKIGKECHSKEAEKKLKFKSLCAVHRYAVK